MRIKIIKANHTHAGATVAVGAVLDVDDLTGDWLVEQDIGHAVPAAKSAPDPLPKLDGDKPVRTGDAK